MLSQITTGKLLRAYGEIGSEQEIQCMRQLYLPPASCRAGSCNRLLLVPARGLANCKGVYLKTEDIPAVCNESERVFQARFWNCGVVTQQSVGGFLAGQ